MDIEVLIATVEEENVDNLIKKMNIKTNAIVANQTNQYSYDKKIINNNRVKIYNFNERGVGLNRNNALMRAEGDIVLIADNDIKYVDEYAEIIKREFENNKSADMIIFNMINEDTDRPRFVIKKRKRVRQYNCLRYGAVRLAVKLEKIKEKNVYFSLLFGGGARYSSGEDSIFIHEAIKKRIKSIYE